MSIIDRAVRSFLPGTDVQEIDISDPRNIGNMLPEVNQIHGGPDSVYPELNVPDYVSPSTGGQSFQWSDLIPGVGTIIGSLIGAGSQAKAREQQERLLREQWSRDDTAYQRKVSDLKAAGLNPNLANGSGATTSSAPMQPVAPLANFGGDVAQAFHQSLSAYSARIDAKSRLALDILNYAKIQAQDIANTYAPDIAKKKIAKLAEQVSLLDKQNKTFYYDEILKGVNSIANVSRAGSAISNAQSLASYRRASEKAMNANAKTQGYRYLLDKDRFEWQKLSDSQKAHYYRYGRY